KMDSGSLQIPFQITPNGEVPQLEIDGQTYALKCGEYTPWVKLNFKAGMGVSVAGIARFMVTETDPEFSLYCTPVQIDPESPALPISHPSFYAAYLAKVLG